MRLRPETARFAAASLRRLLASRRPSAYALVDRVREARARLPRLTVMLRLFVPHRPLVDPRATASGPWTGGNAMRPITFFDV